MNRPFFYCPQLRSAIKTETKKKATIIMKRLIDPRTTKQSIIITMKINNEPLTSRGDLTTFRLLFFCKSFVSLVIYIYFAIDFSDRIDNYYINILKRRRPWVANISSVRLSTSSEKRTSGCNLEYFFLNFHSCSAIRRCFEYVKHSSCTNINSSRIMLIFIR